MKYFFIQHNIGRSKFVVNYHDGQKFNPDGSPFLDISIFRNKRFLNSFIEKLKSEGYNEKTNLTD